MIFIHLGQVFRNNDFAGQVAATANIVSNDFHWEAII